MRKSFLYIITAVSILFSQSLTDSLKAFYPFSGNTNDESGFGFDAVNYGAVPVPDRYSSAECAYSFNGSTNYMMIGNPVPDELQIQNEITLSAWIYLTSYPGSSNLGLIVGSQTDYTYSGVSIHIDGRTNSDSQICPPGHIHFQIGNGSWHVTNSNSQVPLNQWVLITATRKANENGKIYYNGVLQPSTSYAWTGQITYNSAWIMMGRQQDYSNRFFYGNMDEIRIFNRALTETEVKMLYANYLPPENFTGRAEQGRNVLSWDMNGYADLEKIRIYRDGEFYGELTVDGEEDSLFYDNNVVPGVMYRYEITSVDIYANESIKTNSVDVTAIEITFTDINAGLLGVWGSSSDWGDYDNDGDLDIVFTGCASSSEYNTIIYRNDDGFFNEVNTILTDIACGWVSWGDYDNDGDLDILLSGSNSSNGSSKITKIYRNDSGTFIDSNIEIQSVWDSETEWGDYDNDGDLDILLMGFNLNNTERITRIYRNDTEDVFTEIDAGLPGISSGNIKWGDYDSDGDLDIFMTGYTGSVSLSRIYNNDAGIFTDINADLIDLSWSSSDWGDYDNDGDLDLLLTGKTDSQTSFSKVYNNELGTFSDINAELYGVCDGSSIWIDYDNDGDLDILLSGKNGYEIFTKIYRNDGLNIFTEALTDLPDVFLGRDLSACGDYDNDGDMDVLITGSTGTEYIAKIFRNNCITPNNPPSSPLNLVFTQDDGLRFSIDPGSDVETTSKGLTYNIDINIGDGTVKTASSDLTTGYRRLPSKGNIGECTSWTLNAEAPADAIPQQLFDMVWRVQTVDNCFAGSAFASKNDTIMNRELLTVPKEIMVATDALTWEYYTPQDSVAGYTLQLSYDSLFTDCFEAFMPTVKENKTVYIGIDLESLGVTDSLENNGRYYWRVKPEHINPAISTGFKKSPDSFVYDPLYYPPSPVSIMIEGNYVTLSWGKGKEPEKGDLYSVYSTDDPFAAFPAGWTLLISDLNATEWTVRSTDAKKFYCVTAAGSVK